MNSTPALPALASAMRDIAVAAGAIALDFFEHGGKTRAAVEYKEGGSPVSEADIAVDRYLHEHLTGLLPGVGWLSEESADDKLRIDRPLCFVVDPIDGTRAFIQGDRRWGVAAALVENGLPVAGIVHMPALAETFLATAGGGATLNGVPIHASQRRALAGARIAGPKKALEALDNFGHPIVHEPRVPSLAYRLAMVAAGRIDGALASTDAWDWDIAAADLIVREAGGALTMMDGDAPRYNLAHPRHGVLAAAGAGLHPPLLAAMRAVIAAHRS